MLEGQKFDEGKLPIFTVLVKQFPKAFNEIARCSASGHKKYPADVDYMNFKRVSLEENNNRYLDACMRHLIESQGGLKKDAGMEPYGGAIHLAQAAWNILAHLEIKLSENLEVSK